MKRNICCILSLLGLVSCQSKPQEDDEKGADFDRMVIIQEDHAGHDIGLESPDAPKMR